MADAMRHGYKVLKPWGDSQPFDVALDFGRRIVRVEAKSTSCRTGTGYFCQFLPNYLSQPYNLDQLKKSLPLRILPRSLALANPTRLQKPKPVPAQEIACVERTLLSVALTATRRLRSCTGGNRLDAESTVEERRCGASRRNDCWLQTLGRPANSIAEHFPANPVSKRKREANYVLQRLRQGHR